MYEKIVMSCQFFCGKRVYQKIVKMSIFFLVMHGTRLHELLRKKVARREDFFVTRIDRKKKNTQITTYTVVNGVVVNH